MTTTEQMKRFYAWWLASLSAFVTRRKSAAQSWSTLLQNTSGDLKVSVRSGSSIEAVGTVPLNATDEQLALFKSALLPSLKGKSKDVLFRLSPAEVITTNLQIPNAASDLVAPILENQLDRLIPWPAAEAQYGYRIAEGKTDGSNQIEVELVATKKDLLNAALERARGLGLEPFAADYASSPDAQSSIELISFRADPGRKVASVLHAFLLGGVALTLIVGATGGYYLWEKHSALTELQGRADSARARVAALGKLAAENDRLRAQRDRLVKRKENEPAAVLLLEGLSRALPNTAFATEVEFERRDVRVVGKSANATAIIADLEDSAHFEDVRFSAPTTRDTPDDLESFVIIGRAEGGSSMEVGP